MQIRKDQMGQMGEASRGGLEHRAIDHLHRSFPEQVWRLRGAPLLDHVRNSIDKALAFGVTIERDVLAFVDLTFELSPRFFEDPQYPAAREALENPALDSHAKIEAIRDRYVRL